MAPQIDFIPFPGGGGGGVTSIVAGTNITISPPSGLGAVTVNATGGAGSLQSAYNGGNTIAEAGALPVAISSIISDNADILTLTKNPPAAHSGRALTVVMGSNTTDAAVRVTQNGSGAGVVIDAGTGAAGLFMNGGFASLQGNGGTAALIVQQSNGNDVISVGSSSVNGGYGINLDNGATFWTAAIHSNLHTMTQSVPFLDFVGTWNNAGVTFTGIGQNITNTASAAASRLIDLQVGGVSQFNVDPAGNAQVSQSLDVTTATGLKLGTTNATSVGIGNPAGGLSTLQVFINQGGAALHGSNAGLQFASTTANRGSCRFNQYGNNAGVPGITGFKSRNANVGGLTSVADGDVLFRATAIGVAGDNASIPLAGFISIQVPTGGTNATWVATDFSVSLVPLAGPINSNRQVARITSEAAFELINGTTASVSPATKGSIRYNNTSKVFEYSADTGPWTAFGNNTLTVDPYTANFSLTVTQNAHLSTNTGAAGEVILTLPAITLGAIYSFATTVAQFLRVAASGGATINLGITSSAVNGFVRSTVIGSTLELVAVSATQWMARSVAGTWTVDT